MEAIQTRALTPLSLSDLCAQYLQDRFQFKLNACSPDLIGIATTPQFLPPLMLPIPLTSELDRIAIALVDAFLNRGEFICETPSASYSEIAHSWGRLGCYTLRGQAPKKISKFRDQSCKRYRELFEKVLSSTHSCRNYFETLYYCWQAWNYISMVPSRDFDRFSAGECLHLFDYQIK